MRRFVVAGEEVARAQAGLTEDVFRYCVYLSGFCLSPAACRELIEWLEEVDEDYGKAEREIRE